MHIASSTPTIDGSRSVAIALQLGNRQDSTPSRFEQMAAQVAQVSRSRQAMLGTLLDATLPTTRRGRPAFRAVWVDEAMSRAYNMIRLTALSEKFALPSCLDVTAGEGKRPIAREVATVLQSMDVDDDDEPMPCSVALMTVVRGLNDLFAPATGSLSLTADIARLSLPQFKCRALVLAACELVSELLLRGLSHSGRGQIQVALYKSGQGEMGLKITGSGLGTMCEPPSESLADLAELLESNLSFRAPCFGMATTELIFRIGNPDDRSATPISS